METKYFNLVQSKLNDVVAAAQHLNGLVAQKDMLEEKLDKTNPHSREYKRLTYFCNHAQILETLGWDNFFCAISEFQEVWKLFIAHTNQEKIKEISNSSEIVDMDALTEDIFFECLLADDGKGENTLALLQRLAAKMIA